MFKGDFPGADAVFQKGLLRANKWLILRRLSQLGILLLFLGGPWFGIWLVKGNLASSVTLNILPLTDPFVTVQMLFSGHIPEITGILGVAIVLAFYLMVGGRTYCSWVCPVNIVTDTAEYLRRKFNIKGGAHFSRQTRFWILGAILAISFISGTLAWELINPVSMVFRGLVFGLGMAWGIILAIFLLDLFISRRAWCGHLCPVGAFYSLIGRFSVLRINALNRDQCNDCMDCFAVCPEHQIIRPALKGEAKGLGPVINDAQCTNCARCIDVCAKDVFVFSTRFKNQSPEMVGPNKSQEVSP